MSNQSSDASEQLMVVFCTFPSAERAGETAQILVGEELCACVNILLDVRSIYRWNGEIVNNHEVLCLIKTPSSRHASLLARLAELHPYDVPEMVTVTASHVNESYLRWVLSETDAGRLQTNGD
jgi:periplasmic divalent cation tolerance protein